MFLFFPARLFSCFNSEFTRITLCAVGLTVSVLRSDAAQQLLGTSPRALSMAWDCPGTTSCFPLLILAPGLVCCTHSGLLGSSAAPCAASEGAPSTRPPSSPAGCFSWASVQPSPPEEAFPTALCKRAASSPPPPPAHHTLLACLLCLPFSLSHLPQYCMLSCSFDYFLPTSL